MYESDTSCMSALVASFHTCIKQRRHADQFSLQFNKG